MQLDREPWYTDAGHILRPHQGVLAATDSANKQLGSVYLFHLATGKQLHKLLADDPVVRRGVDEEKRS